MPPDRSLYDVLGVPPDADAAAIRRAYRARSKQVHPDTGGDVEQFALVKRAHDALMDGDRRAQYDRTGEVWCLDEAGLHRFRLATPAIIGARE